MPTPTIIDRTTARSTVGLTGKGRAVALLVTARERWAELSPQQQAECSAILDRLSVALRREQMSAELTISPRPLPLVGRLSA